MSLSTDKILNIGKLTLGNDRPFVLIAGPCVIESADHCMEMATRLAEICADVGVGFIFKASFDKANRSSASAKRGIGEEKGLTILSRIRQKVDCPVTTDVHQPEQCARVAEHVDILQIPALLCRQTDLLLAAGRSGTVVNIKKGPFLAPWDMKGAVEKVLSTGNTRIMVSERGTSFGYNRLVSDLTALPKMADLGCPVVFDASHSLQSPAEHGDRSGGDARMIPVLARAAAAVGIAALFIETHDAPAQAHCDRDTSVPLAQMKNILRQCCEHDRICKNS